MTKTEAEKEIRELRAKEVVKVIAITENSAARYRIWEKIGCKVIDRRASDYRVFAENAEKEVASLRAELEKLLDPEDASASVGSTKD